MRCAKCPLFSSWSNESDRGEACGLFGDAWDSPFQYEDEIGNVVGCYIDKHFIENRDAEYGRELENRVKWFREQEMTQNDQP